MRIIVPVDIDPELLEHQNFNVRPDDDPLTVQIEQPYLVAGLSTNVPENDYPKWQAGSHSLADRRVYEHRIYEVVAATTDDPPALGIIATPQTWIDIGPTNRWAMFDDKINTATKNPDSIEVSVKPLSSVDTVAFFGVSGGAVSVRVVDPSLGITFESLSSPTNNEGIQNWHEYFFEPLDVQEDFIIAGLNATKSSSIEIKILSPGGIAKAGAVIIGKSADLGIALYGTSIGIVDFSRKGRDEFGNYSVVERDFSKRAEYDIVVETKQVARVQRLLARHRARALVWIGEDMYESTIVYGYYRSFNISISGPAMSSGTISVEGLN